MDEGPTADDSLAPIRAFLALDLDPTSLRRVARVADRLRMASGAPRATWVLPAQMHVTLKFMAQLPKAAISPLASALRAALEGGKAPKPSPVRLDAFPTIERAHVVVVELLDPDGDLGELAKKVDLAGEGCGLAQEQGQFRPHVTLARLKRSYDARRWLKPELADMSGDCAVVSLTLFRSELSPAGPTHTPLARIPFVDR